MASLSSKACVVGLGMFFFFLVVCGRVLFLLGILVLRSTSAKFTIHLYS
jgi:hypothetical protein